MVSSCRALYSCVHRSTVHLYNLCQYGTAYLLAHLYTRFGLLTYRNITWFKQLTVHTNRKRESKFRCASKYHLPYSISVYESIYIKCNVRVSAMLIRVVFLNTGCTSNRFHDYSFTGETNNPVLSTTVSYLSSHRCGVFGMMP